MRIYEHFGTFFEYLNQAGRKLIRFEGEKLDFNLISAPKT